MLRPSSAAICGDRVPCPYRTPDWAFAIASPGRIAIIEPSFRGGVPMANVPGVVTDPSRIKGGVVSLTSGGAQIPAYMARPNQPGNYPGIVRSEEHTSELQSLRHLVCRLLLEKKNHALTADVPVPLRPMHAVLVQHAPTSILLLFDVNPFYVDGAYDISSEILRMLIHSAVLEG